MLASENEPRGASEAYYQTAETSADPRDFPACRSGGPYHPR